MKNRKNNSITVKISSGLLAGILTPGIMHACACGCGVFDVATSSMFPEGQGGMAFVQYDYMDQNRNWSGSSEAPAANNDDKELETHFVTFGAQYMFNDKWGAQLEVPYDFRYFKGTDEENNIASHNWSQLGDIRIEGIYTGFVADLSAGVTLGLKLPTGSYTEDTDLVDRDTQIGTGSTDVLLGGFFRHNLSKDQKWDCFAQLQLDVPVLIQDDYRPGIELDTAAGIDYKGFSLGGMRISPVAQVIFSERTSDSGSNADPDSTGYQRIMLSPGIEFHIHPVKIYADAEFPVYQNFTGNQLAAPVLFKVSMSYMF
jgi:Putative MetA-pathway of phenol degradation